MPLLLHNKKAPLRDAINQQYILPQQRIGRYPGGVTTAAAPKSRTARGGFPACEMTLDYLFLAIETILCSQGSFRRDLGI